MIIDPADIDWTQETDTEVYLAAVESEIPQAIEEANRRGLLSSTEQSS